MFQCEGHCKGCVYPYPQKGGQLEWKCGTCGRVEENSEQLLELEELEPETLEELEVAVQETRLHESHWLIFWVCTWILLHVSCGSLCRYMCFYLFLRGGRDEIIKYFHSRAWVFICVV